ncbi:tyrosine-type recombinase/integrase [Deinococcus marmoris]|uniref:tyrosine-type recombinase/integrase n=1 Tax=Deinococcus marmoris TaxID=249408 RepID=UPI001FDEB496|nr:site-specific integrase [Deinococcus marmoris]
MSLWSAAKLTELVKRRDDEVTQASVFFGEDELLCLHQVLPRCEGNMRIGEALGLHRSDLDLTRGDEHLTVLGKGGRRRTVLLDDPALVARLRRYLKTLAFTHGPLFQATKNGRGGPLRYQSVQARWQGYAAQAEVRCTLHQLRHSHATELVNGGVSLATIRKRLGHQHIQTTLRYAEISDGAADQELRQWRRQRH